jgi:hypothetical protein
MAPCFREIHFRKLHIDAALDAGAARRPCPCAGLKTSSTISNSSTPAVNAYDVSDMDALA